MSEESPRLVPLIETTNPVELASIRSVLESAEISFVVQGEHHHQLAGGLFGSPAIAPRVLVDREDLGRAQHLLSARPVSQQAEVCAVHEKPSTAHCSGCGAALCTDCEVSGTPPVCEACASGDNQPKAPPLVSVRTMRKTIAWLMLTPVILAIVALLVIVVLRLAGVLPLKS